MLSGRRKKDYAAESAAEGLEVQAAQFTGGDAGDEASAPDGEGPNAAEDPIAESIAA